MSRRPSAGHGQHGGVRTVDYDLGAKAFTVPGLLSGPHRDGPMELTGEVTYPTRLGRGKHPLVMIMPGYWTTCADAKAQAVVDDPHSTDRELDHAYRLLGRWTCAKGTPPLPSYLGYRYLTRSLAARGDVVVSISANGANAIDSYRFQGDQARMALIGKNLRLWRDFAQHDAGALAPVLPHTLVGHVDLQRVGLIGHSRAGRAVLQYARDAHRQYWPAGVRIAAVLGLAPAGADPSLDYTTTTMPVGLVYGTCDGAVGPDDEYYYTPTANTSPKRIYEWTINGANHDYWNVQWSPSSGQVGAYDDSYHDPHRPNFCTRYAGSSTPYHRQLTEVHQRHYGAVYVADFFTTSFTCTHRYDALLLGRKPLSGVHTKTNAHTHQ